MSQRRGNKVVCRFVIDEMWMRGCVRVREGECETDKGGCARESMKLIEGGGGEGIVKMTMSGCDGVMFLELCFSLQ